MKFNYLSANTKITFNLYNLSVLTLRCIKTSFIQVLSNWLFWLFTGICFLLLTFIVWLLPIVIKLNLGIFYTNVAWLTTSYPATIIIIVFFCGITSEFVVNKQENIFYLTKDISRAQWFFSKYISTLVINLIFILIFFMFYVGLDRYLIHSNPSHHHLFNTDVKWYGLLITFLIFGLFGMTSTLLTNFIHWQFVSSIILTVIAACFVLFFPMVWYIDNPYLNHRDSHRWWYLLYGPLSIFLPLTAISFASFYTWFLNKRLEL
jgi:hypothetical protein